MPGQIVVPNMDYRRLMMYAYRQSWASDDPNTRNGAVLVDPATGVVLVGGCNKFPEGINVSVTRQTTHKYDYMIHGEEDTILRAARDGVKTEGMHLVVCWAACLRCCRAIIEAGITTVVSHQDFDDMYTKLKPSNAWAEEIAKAKEMFKEANVEHLLITGKIGSGSIARTADHTWEP